MAWTPIVGKGMSLPELQHFIDEMIFDVWKPNGMVLHNTGAPTLRQWHQVTGETRMRNLENYFRNQRGWPSAPHAFVADDLIWPFTPFNRRGTHSPSWNGTKLGIEMVGDFSVEDDDAGLGLRVKLNTVALFAMLHLKLGLDPETIRFHKEDPRTTHNCPGKDIEKPEFIHMVKDWMNHGGDYADETIPILPQTQPSSRYAQVVVDAGDTLNLRDLASVSGKRLAKLPHGKALLILGEEMNGPTKWYRVKVNDLTGWAAARFIKENVR